MKNFFFNGLLIIVSIGVALALTEGALRLSGIDPSLDRLSHYDFDATLGWVPKKHFKYYRSSLSYGHFNYYNPDGYPTDLAHFDTLASATVPSIAIVGDSFAESYYASSYEKSFPYLLGASLPQYQILNLGVSGYAPDQYLLRARTELPKFSGVKKIVVMLFPLNDLPDLNRGVYQGYNKPYFADDNFTTPANTPLERGSYVDQGGGGNPLTLFIRNTALYAVLRPIARAWFVTQTENPVSHVTPDNPDQLKKALSMLKQIQVENPGAELLAYRVSYLEEYKDKNVFDADITLFNKECTNLALRCADMSQILASVSDPSSIFIPGDGHFSDLGSSKVASQLKELLTQ